ncbi:MAG: hypothetical protein SPI53_01760 [Erysipelotrichaceae bacterium]|nr:hypothetical protein [Erysipelotrichaceae bacterium]
MDNNKLIITDDNNIEYEFEIVFTFDSEDGKHHYVLAENDDQGAVFEYFEDDGSIEIVDDENIINMADELLQSLNCVDDGEVNE